MNFFNSAFAGRLAADPYFKEAYYCDIIKEANFSAFLDEYTGYDTDCHANFSTIENNPYYDQVKITASPVVIGAYPAYTVLPLDATKSQFNGQFILPQTGNVIVAPPYGAFLLVTAVSPSTPSVTVQQLAPTGSAFTIPASAEMKVLAGKYLADCACPSGQFRVPGMPIVANLVSKEFASDSGELCGDALYACQNLKIPFTRENGQITELWWNEPLAMMYRDHEKRKLYTRLLDPDWGLIPTLVARGGIFTTSYTTSVTIDDIYTWGTELTNAGISNKDYAIFAGRDLFVQFQRMLNMEGVDKIIYGIFGDECKWLNLNWCGLSVGGLNLYIYEEPWMSSSLALGGPGYNFRKAGIMVPLGDRQTNLRPTERGGFNGSSKMLTTVYFQEANGGRVHDNLQDGNGIYGPRNTFGTGCDKQEWTVKSRFSQIVHCPQAWGLINFL